jgi:hypothetical protein
MLVKSKMKKIMSLRMHVGVAYYECIWRSKLINYPILWSNCNYDWYFVFH